jgi:hypothetical protein
MFSAFSKLPRKSNTTTSILFSRKPAAACSAAHARDLLRQIQKVTEMAISRENVIFLKEIMNYSLSIARGAGDAGDAFYEK